MKEIDFIPEWYKANRNRRKRYHRQYLMLTCLLAVMMVWSFIVGRSVERLRADVEDIQSVYEKGEMKVRQGIALETEIAGLQQRVRLLETAAPRTDISPILAELSWVIRENIVLSKLSLQNEPVQEVADRDTRPAAVVQLNAPASNGQSRTESLQPVRTRVVLTGMAAEGADAAVLISRLEESAFFEQVTPVYTRAVKMKDCVVTEFEIACYIADYDIKKQES